MPVSAAAIATTLLKRPLDDLYLLGKEKFGAELAKWNNEARRKHLAQKVLTFDKIRTIWQKNKDVRINDIYYPPKINFSPGVSKSVDSLAKLPQKQNYVVEGIVGQGKSVFLRYLCLQELREKGTSRIPVFFECRNLEKFRTIESGVTATLDALGFSTNSGLYDFYLKSGKIVLLLDGFDELPSSLILGVMEELDTMSVKYPDLQIIVTSRPDRDIQKSTSFKVLSIMPLSPADFDPFLSKIGLKEPLRAPLLTALQQEGSQVAQLLTTPLMLTLAAFVYRTEREIPPELPQFYEVLFQTVFTAHDKAKIAFTRECKSGLDERTLQRFFECFCFMALNDGQVRSLKPNAFDTAFTKALTFSKEKCCLNDFKHDIVDVACLMQQEGFDTTFIHQSVQEYYAASFVKHCYDDAARKFYEARRKTFNHGWGQVLQFLSLIDEYRWAKYYRLPLLDACQTLMFSLGQLTLTSVRPLFDNTIIYCSSHENGDPRLEGFSHYHPNFLIADLLQKSIINIVKLMGKDAMLKVLEAGSIDSDFPAFKDKNVRSLKISALDVPSIDKQLLDSVVQLSKEVAVEIVEIRELIDLEEKKEDIFSTSRSKGGKRNK